MTAEPKDKSLYKYVKRLADKKFKSKTGVYKSSWIVKEYKRRGGIYKNKKGSSKGLKRWYKEKWVDLNRPIKNSKGRVIGYKSCGRRSASIKNGKYPVCRPTKRVSPKTPRTWKQISKGSISKAKREKQRVKSRRNIKFGGDASGKKYEFHDLFIKSCKCEDSKCKCDTKRESKRCTDDKCEVVKVPENKKEILESYYKQTGGVKMYKCKKCPYSTNSKMEIARHKIKHIGQKQYKCERCDYISFRKEKVQLHKMKQHGGVWKTKDRIKKGVSSYKCPVCSKQFNRRDHTTRHMKGVHPKDELMKQMVDLDEWYKKSLNGDFEGIKQVGSGKMRKKMKCPICFKELGKDKYDITRHLKSVHKNDLTAQQIINLDKWYKRSIDDNFMGIKQVGSGKDRSQYYGKRSKIMVKVPENVKKTAKYAFKLKKLGFKGGIETGWKRAKQLANRDSIPIQDLKYMRAWFARHLYTSYPAYRKWKRAGRPKGSEWHNKRGIQAWLIWSGDAGFRWVNSTKNINLLNKHYNKSYKALKLR